MISMKPCPFCGATENGDDPLVDGMNLDGTVIWVCCLDCGAAGPPVDYVVDETTSVITSWPKAIEEWNRREREQAND